MHTLVGNQIVNNRYNDFFPQLLFNKCAPTNSNNNKLVLLLNFIFLNNMNIKTDFCLKPFNTFGIEVMAKSCAQLASSGDLFDLYESGELQKQKVLVIGEASNILFLTHFEGLVIMPLMRGKKVILETENEVLLEVGAGEYWSSLVDYTVDKDWWGIENLSLIPGKVGAAPVQNIGAYGTELKDVFESLEAFDMKNGAIVNFKKEECKFGYRNSIFKNKNKGRFVVLNITLKLSKLHKPNLNYTSLAEIFKGKERQEIKITEIRDAVNKIRESKLPDPDKIKNAGSFFKNPIVESHIAGQLKSKYPEIPVYEIPSNKSKLAAAWLIEQCGWKGKRIGDAGVHDKQALVLVNHENASGKNIFDLSEKIKASVLEKFGVELEREVLVV